MENQYPVKMKALWLSEYGKKPELRVVDVPKPGKREVLIKIAASPINPSDAIFLQGKYPTKKSLPVIPGFEASGQVVDSGNHFLAKRLRGKNVACFAPLTGNGSWAEYMVTDFTFVSPLKKDIPVDLGSMLMVNPTTALAFIDICKKHNYKAMVNTAAASALGKMLIKACSDAKVTLINVVHRQEQVELLAKHGAKNILNSSDTDYLTQLQTICKRENALIAFDAIGGSSTQDLLSALPKGGEVRIYGRLSGDFFSADVTNILFERKQVSGFWLSEWIPRQPLLKLLKILKNAQKLISSGEEITIHKKITLDEFDAGIEDYLANMTAGKVLLCPGGHPTNEIVP
ncbi:MAG TPA: zinc-binding dehydrogenase [Saprospiraceae bacterium]|nr:zinc-binding dehydrogenase [Saprospiraceae bacterium]MCB9271397.1 zinc-binding dehydrogenase [Lewinellaceae bacterium]HPG07242.1 zinc-binding dehydrogenase [Saprospiraceae bacterium]HRV83780.1 zinc-binding dehydrogenase [Saprospiraceae bacterium]